MGLTVTFTDTSTPTGLIAEWLWDFGDGFFDTVQNPVHTYAAGGTYSVNLQVAGVYGAIGSVTKPVTVSSSPCRFYDFTVSSQGWIVTNAEGVYVPGQGFLYTDVTSSRLNSGVPTGLFMRGVRIKLASIASSNLTSVKPHVLYSRSDFSSMTVNYYFSGVKYNNGAGQSWGGDSTPVNKGSPAPVPVNVTFTAPSNTGTTSIEIEVLSSCNPVTAAINDGYVLITGVEVNGC